MLKSLNLHLLRDNLFVIFLFLVIFTLPYSIHLNSSIIIGFSLLWLLKGNFFNIVTNKLVWLFSSLFLLNLILLFFTGDKNEGIFQLEKRLSLLLFPLIFSSTNDISNKQLHIAFKVFIFSCFLASIICIVVAVANFEGNSEIFYYNNLTAPLKFHYIYFALFTAFAIILLSYFILEIETSKLKIAIFILLIAYFLFFLALLSAKMVIGSLLISAALYALIIILKRKNYKFLAALIFLVFLFGILLFSLDTTRERMAIVLHPNPAYNPFALRLIHWECAWSIVTSNTTYFLIGVGAGNEQILLNECYMAENYWGYQFNYNAHSQYFQTLLNTGIIGLILLISVFIVPIYLSVKRKKYLYLIFMALFLLSCLTESMLTVQKGIVFFALFNSLFAFSFLKYNKEVSQNYQKSINPQSENKKLSS